MSDVIRTKVAVFVDLAMKTEQVRRQAAALRRRATQLQKLAAASVAINSALSLEKLLRIVTDAARDIVGSHQAITLFLLNEGPPRRRRARRRWRASPINIPMARAPARSRHHRHHRGRPKRVATRLNAAELRDHPIGRLLRTLRFRPSPAECSRPR
jgi:hypothetical protein